jgi:hypothetical protein
MDVIMLSNVQRPLIPIPTIIACRNWGKGGCAERKGCHPGEPDPGGRTVQPGQGPLPAAEPPVPLLYACAHGLEYKDLHWADWPRIDLR